MISTLGSAVAATLTAAPALGGESFTAWLAKAMSLTSPAWQLLCGAAALSSLAATVATQLSKSRKLEERVVSAQLTHARLARLHAELSLRQVDYEGASREFLTYLEEATKLQTSE